MVKHKPLTRTEMKFLIYNKVRGKGISYEDACRELDKEIVEIIVNDLKVEKKEKLKIKREEKKKKEEKKKNTKFKEEFSKLTNEK